MIRGGSTKQMDWIGWMEARPERAERVRETVRRLAQPGGITEEVEILMLAVHLLEKGYHPDGVALSAGGGERGG